MFVFKAGVVGAGTLGGETAYVIANAAIPGVLRAVDDANGQQGVERARSLCQGGVDVDTGSGQAEARRSPGLISGTTDHSGEDACEGISAFLQTRTPRFEGN